MTYIDFLVDIDISIKSFFMLSTPTSPKIVGDEMI